MQKSKIKKALVGSRLWRQAKLKCFVFQVSGFKFQVLGFILKGEIFLNFAITETKDSTKYSIS